MQNIVRDAGQSVQCGRHVEIAGHGHQTEGAQRRNPRLTAGQRVNDAVARTQQRHRALRNVTATDNQ